MIAVGCVVGLGDGVGGRSGVGSAETTEAEANNAAKAVARLKHIASVCRRRAAGTHIAAVVARGSPTTSGSTGTDSLGSIMLASWSLYLGHNRTIEVDMDAALAIQLNRYRGFS